LPSHDAGYRNHGSFAVTDGMVSQVSGGCLIGHRNQAGGVSAVPMNQYKNEFSFYILFFQTLYAKNIFLKSFVLFYRYFKKFSKKND
jgi:hypothetical protein